jgi:hypothetical protein
MARNIGGQISNLPIAAGATVTAPGGGTGFYLVIATGAVNIRARGATYGTDAYSLYQQGQGTRQQPGENQVAFDVVDIQNPNTVPVVVSIWTGFSDFVNNQLILSNAYVQNVVNPVYPVANAALNVQIPDLTGSSFNDANGKTWLPLYRIAILVFNCSNADVYFLQKLGATALADGSVGAVQPLTPVRFDFSGDYSIQQAAAINAIISEIYAAIPA